MNRSSAAALGAAALTRIYRTGHAGRRVRATSRVTRSDRDREHNESVGSGRRLQCGGDVRPGGHVPGLKAAAAVAAMIAATAGTANAGTGRTDEAAYTGGGVQGALTVSVGGSGDLGGAGFVPRRGERSAAFSGQDRLGGRTGYDVYQLVDAETGAYKFLAGFCGRTSRAIPLPIDGARVVVVAVAGTCDGAVSVPSQGTVRGSFFR